MAPSKKATGPTVDLMDLDVPIGHGCTYGIVNLMDLDVPIDFNHRSLLQQEGLLGRVDGDQEKHSGQLGREGLLVIVDGDQEKQSGHPGREGLLVIVDGNQEKQIGHPGQESLLVKADGKQEKQSGQGALDSTQAKQEVKSDDVEQSRLNLSKLSLRQMFRPDCRADTASYAHSSSPVTRAGADAVPRAIRPAKGFASRYRRQQLQPANSASSTSEKQHRGPRPAPSKLYPSRWAPPAYRDWDNMAEVDSRDYGRNSYGGGGGGRKRRFREDDDYDRRPQRRQFREPLSVQVRRQILSIAESPLRNVDDDIQATAQSLVDNYDDDYFRNHVTDLLPQVAVEQPLKIPFVAAIVLYTNQQKPNFAQEVLDKAGSRLQAHIDNGQLRSFKLVLRLLACMQALMEGDGVFAVLDDLFNKAADLQSASQEDALGLELVKIIMLTIPYALASTGPDFHSQASEMLGKTDIIASAPREIENVVDAYIDFGDGAPSSQSALALLQRQLQAEADKGWELTFMPKVFKADAPLVAADGATSGSKHAFPAVTIPQVIRTGSSLPFAEVYFSLYADQDIETVPPTTHLAASLVRDALVDSINCVDFNRNAAAKMLIEVDCYFPRGTFVKRATAFDQLKDKDDGLSTWKPEDLAVDAIFSQMLQLPAPEHKLVFYNSMITETCKIAPGAIAPSLGRAIRFIHRRIDTMDVELAYRFLDWFAHHLSNFDFRWKWTEWVDDVERSELHPKKAFILGALDKEVRLSFAKRIRETLPEPYQPLIPASKDNDIPPNKYKSEDTPYSAEANQILSALKRKLPDAEVEPILARIAESEAAREAPEPMLAAIDAYVTSLCNIGSKSLSHVLSYIERCKDRLVAFGGATPSAQDQIISSVVDYWKDVQPGVAVNIIDKLLNYSVLTPASVVEWALGPARLAAGRALAQTWVYEMVARTVGKVTGRVRQIVAARARPAPGRAHAAALDAALAAELAGMRALFATVQDALAGVADGAADAMLEPAADGAPPPSDDELRLLRAWGVKWKRVFARSLIVEEALVAEAAKAFPPPVDDGADVAGADVGGGDVGMVEANGVEVAGNGAHADGDEQPREEEL